MRNPHEHEMENFVFSGKRLRQARRARRWSQAELASRVDAHRITVVRWESGFNEPHKDQVKKLAEVLGQDPQIFYTWKSPSEDITPTRHKSSQSDDKLPEEYAPGLLPQALRQALRKFGDSVYSLSKRLNVDVQTLRDWMGGYLHPDPEQVEQLRVVLGDLFPTTLSYRKVPSWTGASELVLSTDEKLDLILMRLGRIESILARLPSTEEPE